MNNRFSRRLATAFIAASIPLFSLSFSSPAQALTAPASSAADWLSQQLTNGLAHNDQYSFDDYGLSLDIFFALDALDAKPSSADAILNALEVKPSDYIGSGLSIYAGSVGKLATASQLDGRNAENFGGANLIATVEARVVASGAEQGRASDSFDPNDEWGADYSNTFGQAWVVRALATAHSERAADVTSYLLKQQCDNGSVREALSGTQCTSATGSVDATAFGIQALDVAKANGIDGLDDDIADAIAWLLSTQVSSGAFSDAGAFNTNSTGLVASVLADHGQTARAQKAAAWVLGHQVTATNAGNGPLAAEKGAIAYDAAGLTAGKTDGIPVPLRDQWRRATAQAALGINIVLPITPPTTNPPSNGGGSNGGSSGGGSGNGGSSSGNGGTGGLFYGDTTDEAESEPEETVEPEPTPTPEPTTTENSDTDNASAAAKAEDFSGNPTGWIVAGVAGALMLATAGAVGIGRLRGGGA